MTVMAAPALEVTDNQRAQLEAMSRSSSIPHRKVVQAKVLLLAADGVANEEIARRCTTLPTPFVDGEPVSSKGGSRVWERLRPGAAKAGHLERGDRGDRPRHAAREARRRIDALVGTGSLDAGELARRLDATAFASNHAQLPGPIDTTQAAQRRSMSATHGGPGAGLSSL